MKRQRVGIALHVLHQKPAGDRRPAGFQGIPLRPYQSFIRPVAVPVHVYSIMNG